MNTIPRNTNKNNYNTQYKQNISQKQDNYKGYEKHKELGQIEQLGQPNKQNGYKKYEIYNELGNIYQLEQLGKQNKYKGYKKYNELERMEQLEQWEIQHNYTYKKYKKDNGL